MLKEENLLSLDVFENPLNTFWFRAPNDKPSRFIAYSPETRSPITVQGIGQDGFLSYGYVVPVSVFAGTDHVNGISQEHPVESLTEVLFGLIPNYDFVDASISFLERYETISPLFALARRKGQCYDRATVGVALARAGGLEARLVGHDDLYSEVKGDRIIPGELPNDFPHYWFEVLANGEWEEIDTCPPMLNKYREAAKRGYVCAEVPVLDMIPNGFLREKGSVDFRYHP